MKLIILKIIIVAHISGLMAQKYRGQFKNVCGKSSNTAARIVGGNRAGLGEHPWMVRLGLAMNKKCVDYFCGGTLITDRHILSAEHCLYDIFKYKLMRYLIVSVGHYYAKGGRACVGKLCSDQPVVYKVSNMSVYKLDESTYENDVAILELSTKVVFNTWVLPVCLNDKISGTKLVGESANVIGFGLVNSVKRKLATVLQKIQIKIKPLKDCKIFTEFSGPGQLCAGSSDKDSCDGDSGGPLLKQMTENNEERYFQLGIVSFGAAICENDFPAVYTDVYHYLKWIDSQLDK